MACAGLLALVGCGVVLVVLLVVMDLKAAGSAAGIMGVVLGLPALAIALRDWARQGTRATADDVGQARESLAGWVSDQWRHEALVRSLGDPEPMPVRWRLTGHAVMDHPRRIALGAESFTARSDRISPLAAEFRELRHQRLVILGEAGTGKTTLAVQLLLELLDTRRAGERIPVLLSLTGWDTATHPQLHTWLADRLAIDYPSLRAFSPDIARALAEQGHILPILDGLDELPPARQSEVITALNASLTDTDPVVLTSRTCEYTTAIAGARRAVTAAAVIEPEPLTAIEAADYLATCLPPDPGPTWQCLLDRLRTGTLQHLATVLATPLGLWLLRTVYISTGTDPHPLLNSDTAPDADTIRTHLFDQFIPAVLTNRNSSHDPHHPLRPRRTRDATKTRRWLTYLAQHLDRAGTRDLVWWHLARQTFRRRTFAAATALTTALAVALAIGLTVGLEAGSVLAGPAAGLWTGLIFGLVAGRAHWVAVLGVLGLQMIVLIDFQVNGLSMELGNWLVEQGYDAVSLVLASLTAGTLFGLPSGLGVVPRAMTGRHWLTDEPAYANLQVNHRTWLLARDLAIGLGTWGATGLALGSIFMGIDILLPLGLVIGFAHGLIKWVGTPSGTEWADTPQSTFKKTRTLTAFQISIGGLAGTLILPMFIQLATGSLSDLLTVEMVAIGASIGMIAGLGMMSSGAWFSYLLATCRLAAAGKLPLQLMGFLDDAYRLGLLRMSGPAYQFRHAEFHDHLIRTSNPVPLQNLASEG